VHKDLKNICPLPSFFDVLGRTSRSTLELIFKAEALPPLGFKSYHVTRKPSLATSQMSQELKLSSTSKTLVGNDEVMLVFDAKKRLANLVTLDQIYDISQDFAWYEGCPGK
jgi:hypothetical protein